MEPNPHKLELEPAAQAFVEATSSPPFLFQLPPQEGRATVESVQSSDIYKPRIDEEWLTIDGGTAGPVKIRIVRPPEAAGPLPVIVYVHGAGWVFGSAHTHDRLVRDLATGVGAAVVFPEYDLSPEAPFPVAIEQSYAAAKWVVSDGSANGLDPTRIAVAGDSVGGNMAAALTQLAKQSGDVQFVQQVLFYPVTDASFDTPSYRRFGEGYFLSREAMMWFWDQYTTDERERAQLLASPARSSVEDLVGLPPALIITAEADVLRDEGEAYAAKLRRAGVPVTAVRYLGIIHDFVMLNALHDTEAAKAAVAQAVHTLTRALHPTTAPGQAVSAEERTREHPLPVHETR